MRVCLRVAVAVAVDEEEEDGESSSYRLRCDDAVFEELVAIVIELVLL